jgi:hypothetical protein
MTGVVPGPFEPDLTRLIFSLKPLLDGRIWKDLHSSYGSHLNIYVDNEDADDFNYSL